MTFKKDRAKKLSNVGQYHRTFNALWDHISPELHNRLTGKELAMVMDALYRCSMRSKNLHSKEIVAEGAVFDERTGRMVELKMAGMR